MPGFEPGTSASRTLLGRILANHGGAKRQVRASCERVRTRTIGGVRGMDAGWGSVGGAGVRRSLHVWSHLPGHAPLRCELGAFGPVSPAANPRPSCIRHNRYMDSWKVAALSVSATVAAGAIVTGAYLVGRDSSSTPQRTITTQAAKINGTAKTSSLALAACKEVNSFAQNDAAIVAHFQTAEAQAKQAATLDSKWETLEFAIVQWDTDVGGSKSAVLRPSADEQFQSLQSDHSLEQVDAECTKAGYLPSMRSIPPWASDPPG